MGSPVGVLGCHLGVLGYYSGISGVEYGFAAFHAVYERITFVFTVIRVAIAVLYVVWGPPAGRPARLTLDRMEFLEVFVATPPLVLQWGLGA